MEYLIDAVSLTTGTPSDESILYDVIMAAVNNNGYVQVMHAETAKRAGYDIYGYVQVKYPSYTSRYAFQGTWAEMLAAAAKIIMGKLIEAGLVYLEADGILLWTGKDRGGFGNRPLNKGMTKVE